jgi:thiol-disulfide isomerase/thioredoxin
MIQLKKIFPLLLFLLPTGLNAQNVRVSGRVEGFAPKSLVRVLVYADQFSRLKKTLVTTRTDSAGNFRLSFPIEATNYAILAINLKHTGFYLKPGAVYHFNIAQDSLIRNASPFEDIPLEVQMKAGDDSLNIHIEAYDMLYNQLIVKHFRDIYQFHNRKILKSFEAKVGRMFGYVKSPYFRHYMRYSMASMVWGSRTKSLDEIVAAYFTGKPVLYQNIQYTEFFNDFFQSYFESTVKKPVSRDRLLSVIPQRNIKKLDDLFASVPGLTADARVRQLAEMVQLAGHYSDPGFIRKDIEALFEQIANGSLYPENRTVARDYLVKLRILQPGTSAPAFRLPDFTGKEFSLKDFRGKFVLLSFVKTRCPVCNRQLNEVDDMSQKLGADFTNLTIVKGKVAPGFIQKVRPTERDWPFLLLGKSILLLEEYQIVTYPAYVLIDPLGRISLAPAPMPDGDLQQRIAARINAYKKREQK